MFNIRCFLCKLIGLFFQPKLGISIKGIKGVKGTKGGANRYCGMHAYWNPCATSCPDNCKNYGIPRACALNCIQACSCRKGFVFQSPNSKRCIPIRHCPARSYSNEHFHHPARRVSWQFHF